MPLKWKVSFYLEMPTWRILSPAVLFLLPSPITSLAFPASRCAASTGSRARIIHQVGTNERLWNIFPYLSGWTADPQPLQPSLLFSLLSTAALHSLTKLTDTQQSDWNWKRLYEELMCLLVTGWPKACFLDPSFLSATTNKSLERIYVS